MRHHQGTPAADYDRDVSSDKAAIKAAAASNDRTDFDDIMDDYAWWSSYSTAEQDTIWASAKALWS